MALHPHCAIDDDPGHLSSLDFTFPATRWALDYVWYGSASRIQFDHADGSTCQILMYKRNALLSAYVVPSKVPSTECAWRPVATVERINGVYLI